MQQPTPFDNRLPIAGESRLPANSEAAPESRLPDIPIEEAGLKLTSYDAVVRVANLLYSSGLIPTSYKNVKQVMVALLRALELRIPPLMGLEGMAIVNGKVGLMGDLALALVEQSGLLESKKVSYAGSDESLACTVVLKRKGRAAQSYAFSVAEARQANIYERSAVWKQYPKRMTYYRALGFALRDEFSDVLKGCKTVEELQDYPNAEQPIIEEIKDANQ